MTVAERRALVARTDITLNGKPAAISGVLCDFATVAQLPRGERAEWSWASAARIVAKGGAFRT